MNQVTSLVILAGTLALGGCASQDPATSSARSASVGNVAATASAKPQADAKFTVPPDFRRVIVNGQEEYCRKYWPTGSHAESQTECLTKSQLQAREDANRNALGEWKRMEGPVTQRAQN
jgi:hypothetical protein